MAVVVQNNVQAIEALAELAISNPESFLRPTAQIQQTALQAAKALLDPLASSVVNIQTARRTENRKKRKRGDLDDEQPVLQLRQLYTKGYGVKQVWEQAKRILDAAQQETELVVNLHEAAKPKSTKGEKPGIITNGKSSLSSEDEEEDEEEEVIDLDSDALDDLEGEEDGLEDEALDDEDDGLDINDDKDDFEEDDIELDSDIAGLSDDEQKPRDVYIRDPNDLNDGFFSIDDFNKQTQFLEQMDARGDDDNPSDEDEVDWDANPLAQSGKSSEPGRSRHQNGDDDAETDEEDGPTFGNADLNAPSDEDEEMVDEDDEDQEFDGGMAGLSNANEIRYTDFFEPPPKKPSKNKRMRALPKTQPPKAAKQSATETSDAEEERLQNDLDRAMANVRRDLLDSDEEGLSDEDDDDSGDGLGPRKPKSSDKNMSTHEKQQAAISAEIRRLEAANVAKRDWQLSGEARAVDRPVNSLIEEDLEFERTGKPIAPVTAETSEEIDALIKRRILAREFDEVIRRVPGSLNLASDTRRGRIELDDSKPQASLGEIYEAEHQKNADPLSYVDKRSAAVKKKHAEIDLIWKQVRDQLDLLSNMHFKPKRADVEIKPVEDKPRIAMEDARPVGEIESGEGGMLAPQEVYRPGVDAKGGKDVIMLQGGTAVSREELSREEKLRRRRRDKERAKKAQNNQELQVLGKTNSSKKNGKPSRNKKETEKANIIEDLKRGGVKLVGKGGELQSIGKQKKTRTDEGGLIGSNLKL